MNLRPSESRFFVSVRHINDARLIGFLGPLRATTADRHETTNPEQREGAGSGDGDGLNPEMKHISVSKPLCGASSRSEVATAAAVAKVREFDNLVRGEFEELRSGVRHDGDSRTADFKELTIKHANADSDIEKKITAENGAAIDSKLSDKDTLLSRVTKRLAGGCFRYHTMASTGPIH